MGRGSEEGLRGEKGLWGVGNGGLCGFGSGC